MPFFNASKCQVENTSVILVHRVRFFIRRGERLELETVIGQGTEPLTKARSLRRNGKDSKSSSSRLNVEQHSRNARCSKSNSLRTTAGSER